MRALHRETLYDGYPAVRQFGHIRMNDTKRVLIALAGGLLIGLPIAASDSTSLLRIVDSIAMLGTLWITAIRMTVIPLVVSLLITGVTSAVDLSAIGRLGGRTLLIFGLLLSGVALVVVPLASLAFNLLPDDLAARPPLPAGASQFAGEIAANSQPTDFTSWLTSLLPTNPIAAAANGAMLQLILFTLLLALAIVRTSPAARDTLVGFFRALAEAMMVMVGWIVRLAPFGVFALSFLIALRTGTSWASALGAYLVLRVGITLLCVVLLYPISVLLGRTTGRAFARAVFPAQVVALSTRSSLAALPALVAGAKAQIGLAGAATDFILPLSVSLFRIGTVMANPIKLVFLAHVYGVALRPEIVAMFIATEVLFSLSAAGIPNSGGAGGGFRMIPVFVAAGIPVEGVLMLDAVETIPDIFETLANVTGQMSMATLLTRGQARLSIVPQTVPATAEAAS